MSDRENREVSEYERQYPDGTDPQVFDMIDVPLIRPCPDSYQSENWLLDPDRYWQKVGEATLSPLRELSDPPGPLWRNGSSTRHGMNDRIAEENAKLESSSLKLVRAESITFRVFAPHVAFGDPKRRVQAQFNLGGIPYALRVTDPLIERSFLARDDGLYDHPDCYLTVSLGEPFHGYRYKLVAAVMVQH